MIIKSVSQSLQNKNIKLKKTKSKAKAKTKAHNITKRTHNRYEYNKSRRLKYTHKKQFISQHKYFFLKCHDDYKNDLDGSILEDKFKQLGIEPDNNAIKDINNLDFNYYKNNNLELSTYCYIPQELPNIDDTIMSKNTDIFIYNPYSLFINNRFLHIKKYLVNMFDHFMFRKIIDIFMITLLFKKVAPEASKLFIQHTIRIDDDKKKFKFPIWYILQPIYGDTSNNHMYVNSNIDLDKAIDIYNNTVVFKTMINGSDVIATKCITNPLLFNKCKMRLRLYYLISYTQYKGSNKHNSNNKYVFNSFYKNDYGKIYVANNEFNIDNNNFTKGIHDAHFTISNEDYIYPKDFTNKHITRTNKVALSDDEFTKNFNKLTMQLKLLISIISNIIYNKRASLLLNTAFNGYHLMCINIVIDDTFTPKIISVNTIPALRSKTLEQTNILSKNLYGWVNDTVLEPLIKYNNPILARSHNTYIIPYNELVNKQNYNNIANIPLYRLPYMVYRKYFIVKCYTHNIGELNSSILEEHFTNLGIYPDTNAINDINSTIIKYFTTKTDIPIDTICNSDYNMPKVNTNIISKETDIFIFNINSLHINKYYYNMKKYFVNIFNIDILKHIINKFILLETIKKIAPNIYNINIPNTFKINDDVHKYKFPKWYILLPIYSFGGNDIKYVNSKSALYDAIEFYNTHKNHKNKTYSNDVIASEYITNPLLFKSYKFHLRLYYLVFYSKNYNVFNLFYLHTFGKILTSGQAFTMNENLFNKEVHDTHADTTNSNYYYPEHFTDTNITLSDNTPINKLTIDTNIKKINRQIKLIMSIISNIMYNKRSELLYNTDTNAYHIFGVDIMIDDTHNNFTPKLIEVNIQPGFGYIEAPWWINNCKDLGLNTRATVGQHILSNTIYNWINETVLEPLLRDNNPLLARKHSTYIIPYNELKDKTNYDNPINKPTFI